MQACALRAALVIVNSVIFILMMFRFLLQWPTLVTLAMFPVLVAMYVRLARRDEHEIRAQFERMWDDCAARTPAFIPRLLRTTHTARGRHKAHA